MSLLLDILTVASITLAVATAAVTLLDMPARRAKGRHARRGGAASSEWQMVRLCCGVILVSCGHWVSGIAVWPLLVGGIWLVGGWDLASWLRTRYRHPRAGCGDRPGPGRCLLRTRNSAGFACPVSWTAGARRSGCCAARTR